MSSARTTEHQTLLDCAAALSKDNLAPRAAAYDRDARYPKESWQDLWEAGLFGMLIPQEYGGLGLDTPAYISVLETLAKGCASSAMTLHMHSVATAYVAALGTPQQQQRYFDGVLREGKLFGSWASEPQVSLTRTFLVDTSIKPAPGGYVINGLKHFCTMAGAAGYYLVWCYLEGQPDMSHALLQAIVLADNPGVSIEGSWDPIGMRATVSPRTRYIDCMVGEDEVLAPAGAATRVGVIELFGLGYAAIYVGAAQGALDFTTEYCRTKTFQPENRPLAEDPMIQRHCGEMSITLDQARLVTQRAAARWHDLDSGQRAVHSAQAKYCATQAALEVTSRCLQVCGGRAALKEMPIERAFRDVRTATLMPPNADSTLTIIGKDALGIESGVFQYG